MDGNAPAKGFFTEGLTTSDPELQAAIDQGTHPPARRDRADRLREHRLQGGDGSPGLGTDQQIRRRLSGPALLWRLPVCRYSRKPRDRPCKELFGCDFANVQPNSGSQANQGVFTALIKPGDTILGMSLDAGGHLTHGAKPNQSGKWFNAVQYGVRKQDSLLDYDQVRELAQEHQPKLIIAGGSAIPRQIDFAKFREIADEVGAYLHRRHGPFRGPRRRWPSPLALSPFADVATTTTHKTLRGPRGGMILTNDEAIAKKVNSAIFPGIQGGPLMHVIAGKAVAFGEALTPEFKDYTGQVIKNAQALGEALIKGGLDLVTGGTDTHVLLVDLRPKGAKGNATEKALGRAHITCNKNGVPFDPEKPMVTSGIRLGSPAGTTRGFGEAEFTAIGEMIVEVVDGLVANGEEGNSAVEEAVKAKAVELCRAFPIY